MSWGFEYVGSPQAVLKAVHETCDRLLQTYGEKPEGDDIQAVRQRIDALVATLQLGKDQYGTDWNGVNVKASGSHAGHVLMAQLSLSVTRVVVCL